MGYAIIGRSEVDKSPFRYCQFSEFVGTYEYAMRFLAVCCIYPRQVEMLIKTGLETAVVDLIRYKKWNAAAFNWDETNPLLAFGLNKSELREFLAGDKDLRILIYYKQFRRKKIRCSISDVEKLFKTAPYCKEAETVKKVKAHRIEPARWTAYIERTQTDAKKEKKKVHTTKSLAQQWLDYIEAAGVLGYDLTNPLVLMPKALTKKHDLATKAANAMLEAKRTEELCKKERARLEELTEKYAFSTENYFIRAPIDAKEIAGEGKALRHCVGGYANRHIDGKLAILFLRDKESPEKPLVTIEMHGNELVQIHGYSNDAGKEVLPREEYAEIIEPWLKWLKAGSKRDKEGNPKPAKAAANTEKLKTKGGEINVA